MINHNTKNRDANKGISKKDLQPSPLQTRLPSISLLQFPFTLKEDQIAAVDAWINNNYRGTILYIRELERPKSHLNVQRGGQFTPRFQVLIP